MQDLTIVRQVGTFKSDAQLCAIGPQTLFTAQRNKINARNLQGASKQEITLEDAEVLHSFSSSLHTLTLTLTRGM